VRACSSVLQSWLCAFPPYGDQSASSASRSALVHAPCRSTKEPAQIMKSVRDARKPYTSSLELSAGHQLEERGLEDHSGEEGRAAEESDPEEATEESGGESNEWHDVRLSLRICRTMR